MSIKSKISKGLKLVRDGEYKELIDEILKIARRKIIWFCHNHFRKKYMFLKMRNDPRFMIKEPRFNGDDFLNMLLYRPIKKYEVCKIKLGDIRRSWNGVVMKLSDVSPYKYLVNNENKIYEEYCEKVKAVGDVRSMEKFKKLIAKVEQENYDIKKGAIVLNDKNILMDGQHRACIMLKNFGPDYVVDVVRLYYFNV